MSSSIRTFDIYEFAGYLVPGSLTILLSGFITNIEISFNFMLPTNTSEMIVFILLSYLIGHIFQTISHVIEQPFWKYFKGMPTDWPYSKKKIKYNPRYLKLVKQYCKIDKFKSKKVWREKIALIRTYIYNNDLSSRLHLFNSFYGMYRGLAMSLIYLFILILYFKQSIDFLLICTVLILISFYGMYWFGNRYAQELFSVLGNIIQKREDVNK